MTLWYVKVLDGVTVCRSITSWMFCFHYISWHRKTLLLWFFFLSFQAIYISRITEGGAAEKDGKLQVGDRVTSVCIANFMYCHVLSVVLLVMLSATMWSAWWHGVYVCGQGTHLISHHVIFSLRQLRTEHALFQHFLYFHSTRWSPYHCTLMQALKLRTFSYEDTCTVLCISTVIFRLMKKGGMLQISDICMQSFHLFVN